MDSGHLLIGHGHWRWLLLVLVGITALRMIIGAASGGNFTGRESAMLMVARIATYVQLLMGLALVVMRASVINHAAVGAHLLLALLGIAALEVGGARSKRAEENAAKFKIAAIGTTVAFVLFFGTAHMAPTS